MLRAPESIAATARVRIAGRGCRLPLAERGSGTLASASSRLRPSASSIPLMVYLTPQNQKTLPRLLRLLTQARAGSRALGTLRCLPLTPVVASAPLGPSGGCLGLETTAAHAVAFLDHGLSGADAPLLSGPSPVHPEVQLERR